MRPYAFILSETPHLKHSYQHLITPEQIQNQGTVFKVELGDNMTSRGYFTGHETSFITALLKKLNRSKETANVFIKGDDGEWHAT